MRIDSFSGLIRPARSARAPFTSKMPVTVPSRSQEVIDGTVNGSVIAVMQSHRKSDSLSKSRLDELPFPPLL
jgi:hypothetical protein